MLMKNGTGWSALLTNELEPGEQTVFGQIKEYGYLSLATSTRKQRGHVLCGYAQIFRNKFLESQFLPELMAGDEYIFPL